MPVILSSRLLIASGLPQAYNVRAESRVAVQFRHSVLSRRFAAEL
jgi:hypothetical protein